MEITKKQIKKALEKGQITIVSANAGEIVCRINNFQFCFQILGMSENMELMEYLTVFSSDEIAEQIASVISVPETAEKYGIDYNEWLRVYFTLNSESSKTKYLYDVFIGINDYIGVYFEIPGDEQLPEDNADVLIDTVLAENEDSAINAVSSERAIDKRLLYACAHILNIPQDGDRQITGKQYNKGESSGIVISNEENDDVFIFNCKNTENGYDFTLRNLNDKRHYYILDYNEEYQDNEIAAGPMEKEEAKRLLKDIVIEKLIILNFCKNEKEAENVYKRARMENDYAENDKMTGLPLRVGDLSATIYYNNSKENIDIIYYNPL